MSTFAESQIGRGTATHSVAKIEYFRTSSILGVTQAPIEDAPTTAALEILDSPYWVGRIVQGLVDVQAGRRISLEDYLANPG